MYYKFTDPEGYIIRGSAVAEMKYSIPPDGSVPGEWVDTVNNGYRYWAGRLSKRILPDYDTPPFYICFEAEGQEMAGHWSEKNNPDYALFSKVRLIRQLTDEELDGGIDREFTRQLGAPNIYLPINWARKAAFLDRPVDLGILGSKLWQISLFLGKLDNIHFLPKSETDILNPELFNYDENSLIAVLYRNLSGKLHEFGFIEWGAANSGLGYCLDFSIRQNLYASIYEALGRYEDFHKIQPSEGKRIISIEDTLCCNIWESIYFERAFGLLGKPIAELNILLDVWKSGALPLGWYQDKFICIVP